MKQIVILNGPAGVGKTTTGRLLAGLSRNGACIEGDALKHFIVTKEEGAVKGRLGYKNGASLARNFLDAGYDLVVFEYIFPSQEQISYFLEVFDKRADEQVHVITLWAPLEVVMTREAHRPNRERLGDRLTACWKELEANLDTLGEVMMTHTLSPEQVAQMIFHSLDR